ncbi:addiction module antidote protein, HigA family [Duganella sp. CF402]|uniref:HigA family addiction module antitoxin n=1 Tax=unclassified Duganella TaxID=2636909 RepID=UPI0008ABB98A|nr:MULTISPECIES: HigA family addiction module antitoxin [unclassified Duganella]RZT06237.1 addiction module HigA family antidote [Duganella sp. BK701]SEM71031.1 addiction module antidote protein, HigA family [Duganella sp. CF402]
MIENKMRPIHPGEILREDFLKPLKLTPAALANLLDLPAALIIDIVKEKCPLSAEVAQRITRRYGGDAQFWLNLQASYDLKTAQRRRGPARRARSS